MDSESQNSDKAFQDSVNSLELPQKLDNKTKIVILQHPQEKKEALATVPLLLSSLKNIELKIGLSWANLKKILNQEVDYSKWAVIYLGTQAESQDLLKTEDQVIVQGKIKSLKQLEGIVVLDGSWREVKSLWWRNAWLLKLNRIVLNPKKPSAYSVLRREPRKQSLSTLEAVALVVNEIETNSEIKEVLDNNLMQLISKNKNIKVKKIDYRSARRRFRSK